MGLLLRGYRASPVAHNGVRQCKVNGAREEGAYYGKFYNK